MRFARFFVLLSYSVERSLPGAEAEMKTEEEEETETEETETETEAREPRFTPSRPERFIKIVPFL